MSARLVVCVLAVALMAGCAQSAAPPPSAPTATPSADESALRSAPSTSTSSAPTAQPTATSEPTTRTSTPAAPPPVVNATRRTVETVVDWSGVIPTTACVPAGPGSCAYFTVGTSDNNRINVLVGEEGVPVAFDLTLTWDAAAPTTESLAFIVTRMSPCGDGCWEWSDSVVGHGTSPVAVASEAVEALGDGPLGMLVQWPGVVAGPVVAHASPEQGFRVTGTVTYALADA